MEEKQDNEAIIERILRDAEDKKHELDGELTRNPIINKGDSDNPNPAVVTHMSSAGYVTLWDTRTYESCECLYYMLPQVLRWRRPDGSYRFTNKDPGMLPKMGQVKCTLHPDDPNRAHYDELGLPTCTKSNMPNQRQLRMHMKSKHPQEWETLEQERVDRERQEDRALQKMILELQLGKQPVEILSKVPPETTELKSDDFSGKTNTETPLGKFPCPKCGKEFAYQKTQKKHTKTCK